MEFIIDTQDNKNISKQELSTLIKYFLAALTIKEEDLWVNLSPYEKNRVIPDNLSKTDLGKDLLEEDYILKQLVSSLTYPDSQLGRRYWNKIYKDVKKIAGTTNIPINTFNKVWIIPDKATVYENGNIALITKARLKVLSEQDYLALEKNIVGEGLASSHNKISNNQTKQINKISQKHLKGLILPQIEYDINNGKNFSKLRQMYHSLVLATWFKKKLKDSIYKHYIDQDKTKGIDLKQSKKIKEDIYNQYLQSFKKGVYDYIKTENVGRPTSYIKSKAVRRRYHSGGMGLQVSPVIKIETNLSRSASSAIKDISRRKFIKIAVVSLGVVGAGGGYLAYDKLTSNTKSKTISQPVKEQLTNKQKQKFLVTFAQGNNYWEMIVDNPEKDIPETDRITLGKMMEEIDKNVKIGFGQNLGPIKDISDGVSRLYAPDELITKIFYSDKIDQIWGKVDYKVGREFSMRMHLAQRKFKKTLTDVKLKAGTAREAFRKAVMETYFYLLDEASKVENQGAIENKETRIYANILRETANHIYSKQRMKLTESISLEDQKEYISRMRAKLAYQFYYYFAGYSEKILKEKLENVNLHFGTSKSFLLKFGGLLAGVHNPYAFFEYEKGTHGGYSEGHKTLDFPIHGIKSYLNYSRTIFGDDVTLHEIGHIMKTFLSWIDFSNQWKVNSIINDILDLDDEDYRKIFSTVGSDSIRKKSDNYGTKNYYLKDSYTYDPEKETFSNLYMLCEIGKDFPEIIRDGLLKEKLDKQRVAKIYSILNRWRNYLLEHGYKGNPEWFANIKSREKRSSFSIDQPTASSGVEQDKGITKGGIDLNPAKIEMGVSSSAIGFDLPLETIQQFKASSGLTFEILKIEENVDVGSLLGIN